MRQLIKFLILFVSTLPALAGEPSATPILRVEPAMHTSTIDRVSVDAGGTFALTVSGDKTARLWVLATGKLIRVFRPPLGNGEEGKLYCGALTPDGTCAAVSGITGYEWDQMTSVYLFDTTSGHLIRRLTNLPQAALDLAFSADGTHLAVVMSGGYGVRLYETKSGELIGADFPYRGDSCSVRFSPDGQRLVSTSYDGLLRAYRITPGGRNALQLEARQPAPGGKWPRGARFSPDGKTIAVGYFNSTNVSVCDAKTFSLRFAPKTTDVTNGHLSMVAWSTDGGTLFAAGTWRQSSGAVGPVFIRSWPAGGRGTPKDTPVSLNTITDLQGIPGKKLIFSSVDPSWGILKADGDREPWHPMPAADFRMTWRHFLLSDDARTVAFTLDTEEKHPVLFSVDRRTLEPLAAEGAPARTGDLHPAVVEGLPVTGWQNSDHPQVGGRALPLERYDKAFSLAIHLDPAFFVLGTMRFLVRYTPEGEAVWSTPAPDVVCATNLSKDGEIIVSALNDGTIRWYRADSGTELLTLFPHLDGKRWVLWTPQGYYDCSAGAEDLIGWHVNRNKEQAADYFPSSRLRALYYRPDVIQKVLETRDVAEAVRVANAALGRPIAAAASLAQVVAKLSPPIVELASGGLARTVTIPVKARTVAVRYRVRQTGLEKPDSVSVRFNGRPVAVTAPLLENGQEAVVELPLPEGADGEVSIIAGHRYAVSEPAILRVLRERGPHSVRRPNLYLISCGVAHLRANQALTATDAKPEKDDGKERLIFPDLQFAGDDARRFAGLFASQKGKLFEHIYSSTLVDDEATVAGITTALDSVREKAVAGDVVIFFFSGHGHFTPQTGYLLITHDTRADDLSASALSGADLARRLAGIRGSVVLALDTCRSGAALGEDKQIRALTGPDDLTGLVNQLSSAEQGVVVLSSSAENESSFEDPVDKQGLFTKAVAEGLTGKAAQNGQITCVSLQNWISKRVPELIKILDASAEQTPACIMPIGVPDFTLALP